jgi:ATP-binding cassette subfamily B protein
MQARSAIPGRQRWDVGIVLANPRVAELLKDSLLQTPGIDAVHANPITGRLLVHHDMTLTSQEVEKLIREAVVLSIQQAARIQQSTRVTRKAIRSQKQRRRRVTWLVPFAGLVAGTILALIRGEFFRRSSLSPARSVPASTLAILSRIWEESLPWERAILSLPLVRLSLSPSSLLFFALPPPLLSAFPLSVLPSFASSPFLFIILSPPLSPVIPTPFRSLLSSASSLSSNPLSFVGSMLVEHQQDRDLPSTPPVVAMRRT